MTKINCNFSVLISVYKNDNFHHFKESINSVLNQSIKPDQIVIVRDGEVSNQIDSYLNQLEKNCKLFSIIRFNKNKGLAKALNIGVNKCKNDIIFRQDSDDISLYNRFHDQLIILINNKDIALLSSWTEAYDMTMTKSLFVRKVPEKHNDIKIYSLNRTPFNHPSAVFRKSYFIETEGYPSHKNYSEDWWLSLRFIKKGFILHNIPKVLVKVRAPDDWFLRRRGYSYAIIEIKDQYLMYKEDLINFKNLIKNLLIRLPIRLLPLYITRFVYTLIRKFR